MSDDLEPPSPLASRLFAAEKKRAEPTDAVSGRLLARVTGTVVAGAALGAATAAKAATSTGASAGASASASGTAGAASLGLTAKALPWIVGAFVVGTGTGAAVHATLAPATPAVAPVASVAPPPRATLTAVPASATASVPVVTPHDLPSIAPAPLPAPKPSAAPSASNAPDVDLAAERALVDRARSALSAGQPAAAIDAVDAHAARFPTGRLAEEREALAVQALARSGNTAAAKRRADAFRKAYPNSIFAPAVDLAAP